MRRARPFLLLYRGAADPPFTGRSLLVLYFFRCRVTEFASLRDRLDALVESHESYTRTVNRMFTASTIDSKELWDEIADLRDDLHGVANRVESLFRTVAPALRDGEDAA